MRNFRELKVWQQGMEIVKAIYRLSRELPEEEKFGITSQIRRSARSIPANIAEGSSRSGNKDFARFVEIALGSAFELETDLLIIEMEKMADEGKITSLLKQLDEEQRMLYGLHKSLKT